MQPGRSVDKKSSPPPFPSWKRDRRAAQKEAEKLEDVLVGFISDRRRAERLLHAELAKAGTASFDQGLVDDLEENLESLSRFVAECRDLRDRAYRAGSPVRTSVRRPHTVMTRSRARSSRGSSCRTRGSRRATSGKAPPDDPGDPDPPGSTAHTGGRNQSLTTDRRCRS